MPRPTLRERFDARVKWGANDCLIWQGAPNSEGYGLLLHEPYCELIASRLDQGVLDFGGAA